MLLDYNIFYRTFGLRRVEQLMSPRFGHMDHFQLPRRSIVHLAHGNPAKYGPTEQEVSLQGFSAAIMKEGRVLQKAVARPVWVYHQIEFAKGALGNPIRQTVQPNIMIRQYQQTYRRFRTVVDMKRVLADNQSLMVYNYDMLSHLVRYPRGPFNQFYEWYNVERTMWEQIAKTAMESDRPQFIVRHMPQVLPPRSALQLFEQMKPGSPAMRLLKIFDTSERLFLAEMWKWFGLNRSSSLMGLVPRQYLSRVNIVFIESGKWTALNLGMLDSWRKPVGSEMLPDEEIKTNLIDPVKYQNRILRFFMSVTQLATVASAEVTDMANQVLDGDDAEDLRKEAAGAQVTKVGSGPAMVDPLTGQAAVKTDVIRTHLNDVLDDKPDDTAETVKVDAVLDESIDADLAALEKLRTDATEEEAPGALEERQSFETNAQIILAPTPALKRQSHAEAFLGIAQKHLDNGSLSAAQYRQYETVANVYKTLDAPDATMKLDEFITIPPEALKIEKSSSIPDIPTVPDKTMLSSSLLDFDKRYTQQIMQRDVAAAVMCFSQAGYAVINYTVEEHNNLMGSYRMYSVRVQPIDGVASTIHFKLPVVDPDGSYTSNGVKYTLRKQRTELPIVKSAPDTVALTSYYGKAFIRRSEKRVNNYGMWLTNQVMAKMLDELDDTITDGHPGDMSDNLFKGPRAYTIMAAGFSSFKLKTTDHGSFDMSFDHTKREDLYGLPAMTRYEVNGAVIAGKSGSKYFVIAKDSVCWAMTGDKAEPMGSFEKLLNLPSEKAPVDVAVMKIAQAVIPVGVVLAYEIGLEPMLALIKSKVRRVPAGKRLNLNNEEAVVFNDESIIFSKSDQLAGLLLGGFNEYNRHIRRYNSHLFNKKEVYLNILEAGGLGVRYLREMDLFYQMFIDHITHDLLVEMREPTEMRGLLIRAVELLMTDDHPDELDGVTLRLRGYERMAGAVYSEIVRSIRSHNGSAGKSRTPLNMDPYAVFTAVQTDASKAQVNDINPIQNLKEQEAVTYNGTGGRNSRTMTKKTRKYHRNDMGTISSDTVDSSDVAINTYTSADPQFTSLRGLSKPYDSTQIVNPTSLFSTSALMSVGSDRDDQHRSIYV